ncbi:hypothetical protein [Rhabdothermincola salaria]|uniref:hypothetical protein n=1 Tax=Rhabdothermincola salaria TaxID=2903142 RepID=UPI001E39BA2F|nr:hypothetical protein [Rhabdothermincola salaria]MCD9622572.1 hypothetical protein [Rhabdothermincola salaria]
MKASEAEAVATRASATAPGWLRAPALSTLVGGILVLWGVYLGMARISDNSFLTHLATGRLILDTGSIPRSDPYSFSAAGEPWVVQSWLASIVYAGVERLGGIDGVRLLTAALMALLMGIIWALTRPADGLVVRFAVAASAAAVGAVAWSPRPLLFGLVLLGLTLLAVERRWPAPVLVPVFWLWVNTHGSFPLGLALLAVLALGSHLDGREPRVELRALLWAGVGTLLGAVNPLGLSLLTFPLRALEQRDVFGYVVEWQPPDFSGTLGRLFLLQLAIAVAALVRRPSWRVALPLVAFGAMGFVASRNIAVASIVLLPGMAAGLAGLGGLKGRERGRGTVIGGAVLLAIGVLVVVGGLARPAYDLSRFPVDAVAWTEKEGLLGPEQRRMAPDTAGNYLELVLGPEAAVFVDDRVDMYPSGIIEDAVALKGSGVGGLAIVERWHPDVVIWPRAAALSEALLANSAWALGYSDDEWLVFTPADGDSSSLG